ncbi:MAG: Gfo/Idh/MocA family oxidoreductase [Clostridia bacterium]|nr:Gfo/Idh/MocA family oxidoreductase [Clostridia bacterium]
MQQNIQQARIAIIGQGRSGRDIHGHVFKLYPEKYRIVAVAEPLADRRARAVEEWQGADIYEHYSELFGRQDIDLVVNASPSHFHVATTIDLLNHGFNVLCEKPLARYPYEIGAMEDAAAKNKKFFAVFQQSRNCAYYIKMQEVIASGVLGRIAMISTKWNGLMRRWDWQTVQAFGAGSLLNTGPHPMDQCLNLIGFPTDPAPQVFSMLDRINTFGDAEDFAKVILKTPGKPLIDLEINAADAYSPYIYKVCGQYGTFTTNGNTAKWKYYKPEEAPHQKMILAPLANAEGLPIFCGENLPTHEETWEANDTEKDGMVDSTTRFYNLLMESLFNGAPLQVPVWQVKYQIGIMAQVHERNPLSKFVEV